MRRQEIVELLASVPDDAEVKVVIVDDADEEDCEPGSVLNIVNAGFTRGMHVLYVEPS